jgi:hypothetical protein
MGRADDRADRDTKNDGTCETVHGSAAFALPRPSRTLTALTTSALALPGMAGSARADTPIERASSAAAFSYYREDALSPNRFSGSGSRNRYEVYTGQLRFDVPMTARTDLGVEMLYESMSGASPWYVQQDATTGKPLQVMSGATIEDERFDILADVDFYMDNGKDTITAGISTEKDYFSMNYGIGTERNYNDKNTTLSASGGFSYDWIDPTDPNFSLARPSHEEKWSIDLFAGLTQILTRASTMSFTVNYKHSDGYLSDPYKAITGDLSTSIGVLADRRPSGKDQVSLMVRYRHRFEPIMASVHGDYRFYTDDWGTISHTAELAWYQNVLEWLTITPSVRWYSQSKADFYETVLRSASIPSNRSSDYRLSPYGAVSWKLKAEVELTDLWDYDAPAWLQAIGISDGLDLVAGLSYERYYSDGDLGLYDVNESEEAPALVRFRVFAFSVSGRF